MWIYKLLGSGLLLACGILYPCLGARERRMALAQIDALMELVGFIRRQIEYFRLPMRDILARCDGTLLSRLGGRAESLSALFEKTRWSDSGVKEIATGLATSLGRGYYAEQLLLCDEALSALAEIRLRRERGEESRRKTEGVLSLGAAALAVILLI